MPTELSTSFSKSSEKQNILCVKTKKTGVWAFAFILCLMTVVGTLVACDSASVGIIGGADGPTSIFVSNDGQTVIEDLYNSKIKYIGDASGVGKILRLLGGIDGASSDGMELKTEEMPYGIIRNFKGTPENPDQLMKQAAITLALIENADYVNYRFDDATYNYTRKDMEEHYGLKLSEQAKDMDTFNIFYQLVYYIAE